MSKSERNSMAVIPKQDDAQIVMGYNARSDQMISIRLLGKPVNITIVQTQITDAEEEIESFYTSIQEKIDHIPKQNVLIIIGE